MGFTSIHEGTNTLILRDIYPDKDLGSEFIVDTDNLRLK